MTLEDVMVELKAIRALLEKGARSPNTPQVVDIDGKYGNPTVRRDPPKWTGESYKDHPYSECPPDYLRQLAGFLTWQADKDEQKVDDEKAVKYAGYKRTDAARARAWADRIEQRGPQSAKSPPRDEPDFDADSGSEIPF